MGVGNVYKTSLDPLRFPLFFPFTYQTRQLILRTPIQSFHNQKTPFPPNVPHQTTPTTMQFLILLLPFLLPAIAAPTCTTLPFPSLSFHPLRLSADQHHHLASSIATRRGFVDTTAKDGNAILGTAVSVGTVGVVAEDVAKNAPGMETTAVNGADQALSDA